MSRVGIPPNRGDIVYEEPLVDLGVFEAAGRALVATASDSDELARAE